MGSQRWRVAPGLRSSMLHKSQSNWDGDKPIITLCVPMHHYEWRSCNHEREMAIDGTALPTAY